MLWGLALAISIGLIVALLGSSLTTDAELTNDPESYRAYDLIGEHFPPSDDYVDDVVVVRSATLTVDDDAFRGKVTGIARAIAARNETLPIRTYYDTRDPALVAPSRRATVIPLGFTGDGEEAVERVIEIVDEAESGGFETGITGEFTADRDFTTLSEEDLQKGELQFGLPVALLVLLLVFGSVVAGLLPVLVALVSIVVALGLTALLGQGFELSFFVVNMISGMGLALGIDYSLVISRATARNAATGSRSSLRSTSSARPRVVRFSSAAPPSCWRCSAWCSCPTPSSAASLPARSSSGSSPWSPR